MPASASSVLPAKTGTQGSPGIDLGGFLVVPPLLILIGCFFYPLSLIVGQAFTGTEGGFSLATVEEVFASAMFRDAIGHTIAIALAASTGCLVLGFVLALILSFVPFPGASFLARLIDTFIALPTFLMALAFTFIYGSAGIINMSLMEMLGLKLPPIDFLYSAWGVI